MPIAYNNTIDLTRYVALGDSITSGYMDGALYYQGQQNSYVNILANQFKLIGGGNFKQPLMPVNSVGTDSWGNSRLVLKSTQTNSGNYISNVNYLESKGDIAALSDCIFKTSGPFNNMGVPGAKIITTIMPGFGNSNNGPGYYNPFFTRMASDQVTASILSDALNLNPSFFSLFIGNNDVLAYALSGGTLDKITPPFGQPGVGFEGSLNTILDALTSNSAKGIIANIPNISSIPYFTGIPYNGLIVTNNTISELNKKYNSSGIFLREGKNNFIIEDIQSPNGIRQIKKGEFVLLDVMLHENKLDYLKGYLPIPKIYTLNLSEIDSIQKNVSEYNGIIKAAAIQRNLAFVDVNYLLKTAKNDRVYNDTCFNFSYKKRGVFSLDGLHPNSFGHYLLANEFIKAINSTYNCNIPLVKRYKII